MSKGPEAGQSLENLKEKRGQCQEWLELRKKIVQDDSGKTGRCLIMKGLADRKNTLHIILNKTESSEGF